MRGIAKRSLDEPDERREFDGMTVEFVNLGEFTLVRQIAQPGWKWSEHVRPVAGTEWCQVHHRGTVVQGRLRFEMPDGTGADFGPGDVYDVQPGHDGWVLGDETLILLEMSASMTLYGLPPGGARVLTTLLFTDVVDSTAHVRRLGDDGWKELLGTYNGVARNEIERYGGSIVDRAGDGIFARFDGAARAILSARAMTSAARRIGMEIRSGVHTGEVEVDGAGVRGYAVHEAARVMGHAQAGETLVSEITRALSSGSGLSFADRGEVELRGVDGARRLYAVLD